MKGDNIESVPAWVYRRDVSWTAADPLTVDEEPWRHDPEPDERPEAVIAWVGLALLLLALTAIVVAAWRR